jgi:hypothetical protein
MNERGKSDGPIVPRTPANNGIAAQLDGSQALDHGTQNENNGTNENSCQRDSEDHVCNGGDSCRHVFMPGRRATG